MDLPKQIRTASRLTLPQLANPPATVLDFLAAKYPQITRDIWLDRIQRGLVCTLSGRKLSVLSPYAHGLTITYFRESPDEPVVPFSETIIYRDDAIIVADKPHFLPVTPAGNFVDECLLGRLQRRTGFPDMVPAHRLDRDTAGLVLMVINREHRAVFHGLFEVAAIEREYTAVAHVPLEPRQREWIVENRMAEGEPWYRRRIVEGDPNTSTRIVLKEWRDGRGLFQLIPSTGKKHQLRVHMASLGFPIVNDPVYPDVVEVPDNDYSRPLQLLACRLAFANPLSESSSTGTADTRMVFVSDRSLQW